MKDLKTIAAIATANGLGAISIVRLSGPNTLKIALSLTHAKKLSPRYAHLLKIYDEKDEFLDEAIVIYFKAPKSFTGEDVIEFQTHGGFSVASLLLEALIKKGAQLAKPGEFSKRALLNGKMSLLKAMNTASLISAKSENAARIIARNLEGKLGEFLEKIRLDLVKTLAFVETSIDYAEDDLPTNMLENITKMCEQNARDLERIAQISLSKKALIQGFKIAIIGKPNVGKSSLLNAFLNKNRAIVSNEAGTTRDIIEDELKIGTHLVKIIDTAGIRKTQNEIENKGIELSKEAIKEADIIIALFDSSRAKDSEDEEILNLLSPYLENDKKSLNSQKKVFLVLNKSDLKAKFELENAIKLCAKDDISKLIKSLEHFLNTQESTDFILPNLELINAFERASRALFRAKNLISDNHLELFAFELNLALSEIAKFTHNFEYDELLDSIFSEFCLGK